MNFADALSSDRTAAGQTTGIDPLLHRDVRPRLNLRSRLWGSLLYWLLSACSISMGGYCVPQ
jgi:hypothetical protein